MEGRGNLDAILDPAERVEVPVLAAELESVFKSLAGLHAWFMGQEEIQAEFIHRIWGSPLWLSLLFWNVPPHFPAATVTLDSVFWFFKHHLQPRLSLETLTTPTSLGASPFF